MNMYNETKANRETFIIDGREVEFTVCTYEYDGERVEGLFIHDTADQFHDGDGVIGNCCSMPEQGDHEGAEEILKNEWCETDCAVLATVIFEDGLWLYGEPIGEEA